MTPDEIERALKSSAELPREALAAGVGVAADLAPRILGRAERFCRGIFLLPDDFNVLVHGLHILAAARHPGLMAQLLELIRQPEEDLERLFPMRVSTGLARLLLSVWDRPATELLHMIEHADLGDDARDALYSVLARLTFDGRIARDKALAFLARVECDDLHEDDAPAWWGWEDAVCRLGLTELEPALQRVWSKPGNEVFRPREHAEALADLHHAAANPTDATEFDADDIRAITDPVEALEWIEKRDAALAEWDEEDPAIEAEPDRDPAASIRLDDAEIEWLSGFLASRQAPVTAMSLEQLDGFVTALVIGPDTVLPSEYMPLAWGILDDNELIWEDQAQEEYVTGLLLRHADAIKARRAAHAEHRPILEPFGDGEAWGMGFLFGIEMRADDWAPIFEDRRADQIVLPIVALSGTAPEEVYEEFDGEVREGILDELPVMLQMIAAYWQTPGRRLGHQESVRSAKVGRNDPCPCGSGKKYKKCCGDSARVH